MKKTAFLLLLSIFSFTFAGENSLSKKSILESLAKNNGVCVFVDIKSGDIICSDSIFAEERLPPCSSFKIWNTLIGYECGFVRNADSLFYKWDGKKRFLESWNKDLTFKESFQVSCVPAFQELAKKIGHDNMLKWIKIIKYGDCNISSGIDDFWLPQEGKKSILISSKEQALLLKELLNGKFPFSEQAKKILQEVMLYKKTENGILYGKTGTGKIFKDEKSIDIGWYVGYVAGKNQEYSFACILKGENVSGKNSREIIENILLRNKLL